MTFRLSRFVAVLGSFSLCGLLVSCSKPAETSSPLPPAESKGTNTPTAAVARPEFTRLQGKWARPDGDYMFEIKSVAADGMMEAGYFNPNPIKVYKAAAVQSGETTKVFVELRDVNYPGCTYSLVYDPKSDQLYGQYFQAAMQQTYDVVFERMKQN